MGKTNSANTFWKLISNYKIIIPQLQRDYAQGRVDNPAIEQIRTSLVDELYNHLATDKSVLELNFIYGRTANGEFIPIDGQQRLTTLFLLHWYVFSRANFPDGLATIANFSYRTRDTSKRFCLNLCKESVDFTKRRISTQIKDCYWFTGNFSGDPTVQSMLVMLDTIHQKFTVCQNFEAVKDLLISDGCNVTFLWLEMEDFQKPDDLYIKMNARGKLLSDFEIFKAKLQNSALLSSVLGPNADETARISFISKYNNQYAEFFYKHFGEMYDNAMMDFIKAVIRDEYFCYIVRCGVNQREYRDHYGRIQNMNGNVFFSYLEKGGLQLENCPDTNAVFEESLRKIDKLMQQFSTETDPFIAIPGEKRYYDEKELFKALHPAKSMSDNVIRYALYSYRYKFGCPRSEQEQRAYQAWKRFVYNIVTSINFGGHTEYVCQALAFFHSELEHITATDQTAVLEGISRERKEWIPEVLRDGVWEEHEKAALMLPVGAENEWYASILDAELHFKDGQIGFLLKFSKDMDGSYSIDSFKQYLSLVKRLLDNEKKLNAVVDWKLFDRAMLCMQDKTWNHTAHLMKQSNSSTSWGFLQGKLERYLANSTDDNKRMVLKHLLDALQEAPEINAALIDVIAGFDVAILTPRHAWKAHFIGNDLFSVMMGRYWYKFSNCVSINNEDVLLLTTTTERGYSMEVNTFLLYCELEKAGVRGMSLELDTTTALLDATKFPKRYIKYRGYKLGYLSGGNKKFVIKKEDTVEELTREEVIARITGI